MQIPRDGLEHGQLIHGVEPLRQARILRPQRLVEHHDAKLHRADGEQVGQGQLIANQVLVLLQVGVEELAVGVEGAQAVVTVHAQDLVPA